MEKKTKALEHQEVISEAVSISLAEEQGNFIISKMLPKKQKHDLRLEGLGVRASSAISWHLTLGESPSLSEPQFPPPKPALTNDPRGPLQPCSSSTLTAD